MNQTQLWFCDICDKTINFESKSNRFNSERHKHKKAYGSVVKEYIFINPQIDEVKYLLNDTNKDCRKNFFPSLGYRSVYDNK